MWAANIVFARVLPVLPVLSGMGTSQQGAVMRAAISQTAVSKSRAGCAGFYEGGKAVGDAFRVSEAGIGVVFQGAWTVASLCFRSIN
ncbi:MAG TPA: hypothetical protein PKY01_12500 [Candidatus Hydrogenedentes bacterium]|nr:hypothetical protein [Candidatus Hydrogenedentota bacterium]